MLSPTQLRYRLDFEPSASSSSDSALFLGFANQGISADNGSECLVEGNRIFGMPTGGPYHDTFSSKNLTLRNNYYADVVIGPTLSLGVTSPLKRGSGVIHQIQNGASKAIFFTQQNHDLQTGDCVIVRGAIGLLADTFAFAGVSTYGNSYNGKFLVTRLSDTSFSYLITAPLGGRFLHVGGTGGPSYDSLGGFSAAGSPVFEKVSGEKRIKTGSSLIRKTDAATTAVFTTVLPHNLLDGQKVKIRGARVGNDGYPAAFNPDEALISLVPGQPTQFEFGLGSGTGGDPDASDSPVFSAEHELAGTPSTDSGRGVFTAHGVKRTGLCVGQIVKISGVTEASQMASLNGVFRVVWLSDTGHQFKYQLGAGTVPTAPEGTASFTVFFNVQHIRVLPLASDGISPTGIFAEVRTTEPNHLQRGDTVSIWGATVGGSVINPYNGAFHVEYAETKTVAGMQPFYLFLIALEYDPEENPAGTIMWATQNSTPVALAITPEHVIGEKTYNRYEATFTTDQPAAEGHLLFAPSAPSERSLVSIFGAVLPGYGLPRYNAVLGYGIDSLDNPYNNVVEVLSSTCRSFTFRLSRDLLANEPPEIDLGQPQENPRGAPACARAVATPVTIEGNVATYHTVFPHNMYPGRGVRLEDPGRIFQPPGFVKITSAPDRRTFSWELAHVPAPDKFCRTSYAAIWQSDRLLYENNVIEMGHHFHPDFEPPFGPGAVESWAMPVNGGLFAPQYSFRGLDMHDNVIRTGPGQASPLTQALRSIGVQHVLAENNLIDLPNPGAGENDPSASHPVIDSIVERARYMGNQRPDGEAIRAYNIRFENNVPVYTRYTELPEELTDTLFLTL